MYKLIIIDDDKHTIEGIKKHIPLNDLNIELVAYAFNGIEGIDAILKHSPDIIFCDIQMPQMNGFEMIDCIKELPVAPQIIMLTGFNDFKHAKLAIDAHVLSYLVKPATPAEIVDELKKAIAAVEVQNAHRLKEMSINQNMRTILQQFINKLFTDNTISADDLRIYEAEYSIRLSDMKYYCISIYSKGGLKNIKKLMDLFEAKYTIYDSGISAQCVSFLLTIDKNISSSAFRQSIEALYLESDKNAMIAVSDEALNISDISQRYKQINKILDYAFCFSFSGLHFYDEFKRDLDKFNSNPPTIDKNKLLNAVLLYDTASLYDILDVIEHQFKGLNVYDVSYLISLAYDFCNVIIKQRNNSSTDDTSDLYTKIKELPSRNDIIEFCKNVIAAYNSSTNSPDTKQEKELVEKMITYINNNIDQPISLSSLSRMLYCSRAYLKIIFQKHIGIDFKTYLQDLRMKKAAHLMKTTTYSIPQISELTGNRDLKTFRNTIVKFYGILPSEFQSRHCK